MLEITKADTRSFNKSIKHILHKDIKIRGTIESIDDNKIIISVGPYILHCDTYFNTAEFESNDVINAVIQFTKTPKSFPSIKVVLKFICKSELDWKIYYKKYMSYVQTNRIISNLHVPKRRCPQIIFNIGLIVIQDKYPPIIIQRDWFVRRFKAMCTGANLYVYNIVYSPKKKLHVQFINAIKLFSSYYQIDLICILTPNFGQNGLHSLSNPYVIQNLLAQRQMSMPYTIAVAESNQFAYSAIKLVDRITYCSHEVVNIIVQAHGTIKSILESAIRSGTETLKQIIRSAQGQLLDLELMQYNFFTESHRICVDAEFATAAIAILDAQLDELQILELNLATEVLDLAKKFEF